MSVIYQGVRTEDGCRVLVAGASGVEYLGTLLRDGTMVPIPYQWGRLGLGVDLLARDLLVHAGACVCGDAACHQMSSDILAQLPAAGWELSAAEVRAWADGWHDARAAGRRRPEDSAGKLLPADQVPPPPDAVGASMGLMRCGAWGLYLGDYGWVYAPPLYAQRVTDLLAATGQWGRDAYDAVWEIQAAGGVLIVHEGRWTTCATT